MNSKNDYSEASGSTAATAEGEAHRDDIHGFRLLPVSEQMHRQLAGDKLQGEGATMLEVVSSHRLFGLISRYFTVFRDKSIGGDQADSWNLSSTIVKTTTRAESDEDDAGDEADGGKLIGKTVETVELRPGLGVHEIGFEGRSIRMVLQAIGQPVGCEGCPQVYTTMVLVADGEEQQDLLKAFCDHVLAWDSEQSDQHYNVYMWKPMNLYWHKVATKRVRPIESVVLPAEVKRTVLQDLREFESRQTGRWYAHHGIPYKRSLLFHGPPGAGKSSFITALAGELQRNVCFLQPAHPAITDDNLHACVQTAPANSLIVMEDVDALFSSDRASANVGKAPLTFSGLLNALDGVCNPEGQVFVLTTNHIERLDPALIRPGRVDVKLFIFCRKKSPAEAVEQARTFHF